MKEHDRVVLTEDLPASGLHSGDVGTIVHVYREGRGYEVEFASLTGQTIAVVTVAMKQIRPVSENELVHARVFA